MCLSIFRRPCNVKMLELVIINRFVIHYWIYYMFVEFSVHKTCHQYTYVKWGAFLREHFRAAYKLVLILLQLEITTNNTKFK